MKFKKLFFGLLLSSVFFAACSKDDDIDDVANKLQNRWVVQDALLFAAAPVNDTIIYFTGTSADYFDFRSDGKVYSHLNGETDTADYRLIAGNKIVSNLDGSNVGEDTVEIRILTNSKLQLFNRNTDNTIAQELTINLTR